MLIRKALPDDALDLKRLLGQLGDNYQRSLEEIQQRIKAFDGDMNQLLVLEDSNIVIGMIAFGCYEQFRLSGCCCHIDTLVVDNEHRGKGVGRALLEVAEKYSREHGVTEIELTTANYRRANGTHAFYKSMGYRDHLDIDCTYFVKDRDRNNSPI